MENKEKILFVVKNLMIESADTKIRLADILDRALIKRVENKHKKNILNQCSTIVKAEGIKIYRDGVSIFIRYKFKEKITPLDIIPLDTSKTCIRGKPVYVDRGLKYIFFNEYRFDEEKQINKKVYVYICSKDGDKFLQKDIGDIMKSEMCHINMVDDYDEKTKSIFTTILNGKMTIVKKDKKEEDEEEDEKEDKIKNIPKSNKNPYTDMVDKILFYKKKLGLTKEFVSELSRGNYMYEDIESFIPIISSIEREHEEKNWDAYYAMIYKKNIEELEFEAGKEKDMEKYRELVDKISNLNIYKKNRHDTRKRWFEYADPTLNNKRIPEIKNFLQIYLGYEAEKLEHVKKSGLIQIIEEEREKYIESEKKLEEEFKKSQKEDENEEDEENLKSFTAIKIMEKIKELNLDENYILEILEKEPEKFLPIDNKIDSLKTKKLWFRMPKEIVLRKKRAEIITFLISHIGCHENDIQGKSMEELYDIINEEGKKFSMLNKSVPIKNAN